MIREILDKDPNSWTAADKAELKDWLGPLDRLFSAKVGKLVQPLKVVVYFLALVFSIIRVALYTLLGFDSAAYLPESQIRQGLGGQFAAGPPQKSRIPQLHYIPRAQKGLHPSSKRRNPRAYHSRSFLHHRRRLTSGRAEAAKAKWQ
jgi:hypothetical protein